MPIPLYRGNDRENQNSNALLNLSPSDKNDLFRRIFGVGEQSEYGQSAFRPAYRDLGQPTSETPTEGHKAVAANGVYALASAFIDRVHEKTGSLPSESDIKNFVAKTMTPSFATKFILGIPTDKIVSDYVDPHLQANPNIIKTNIPTVQSPAISSTPATNYAQKLTESLPGQVEDLYGRQRQSLADAINAAYAEPRRAAIADEAALGRLRSPASIPAIANVDAQKAGTLSQMLGESYGRQTGDVLNTGRLAAELGQKEGEFGRNLAQRESEFGRNLGQQGYEFGANLGLENRKLGLKEDEMNYERGMNERKFNLARELGQREGNASENDFSGVGGGVLSGALIGSKFGPWGTFLGGLGGAGLGLATRRRG